MPKIDNLRLLLFTIPWSTLVCLRLLFITEPFSFDYSAYLLILEDIGNLSFYELLNDNLVFPYVVTIGFTPIEFGFALLVKSISLLGFQPSVTFALIAAVSVGLRLYTMKSLGVPTLWILWLNVFAITLLEANALRLGVASSLLLFALRQLLWSRIVSGFIVIALALTVHLQTALFIAPFLLIYPFSNWMGRSRTFSILVLFGVVAATMISFQLIELIENEKVQEYAERGASGSAGLSVTSILALIFFTVVAFLRKGNTDRFYNSDFYSLIVTACVPSLLALLFLTNVAVIGDRAWQLAFMILSTFFFSQWTTPSSKRISFAILIILSLVMQINILIRYPLSNFFSPIFPSISL